MTEDVCEKCGRTIFKVMRGNWLTFTCSRCGYRKTEIADSQPLS